MLQWELHVQLGWMKDADSAVGGLGSKFPDRGESRSKDLSAALPRVLWPCMTNLKLIVNWSTQQLNYLTALDEPSELNWLVPHWETQILWPAFSGWCLDQALKIPGIISYSRRTSFCKLFIVAHEELSVLPSAVRCQLLSYEFLKASECHRSQTWCGFKKENICKLLTDVYISLSSVWKCPQSGFNPPMESYMFQKTMWAAAKPETLCQLTLTSANGVKMQNTAKRRE